MKRIYKSIVMQNFTYIHNYKYINLLDLFQNVQFLLLYIQAYVSTSTKYFNKYLSLLLL